MSINGGLITHGKARESTITAVVTRADGTVEDLGRIAYWHKNPLRRWAGNFGIQLRRAGRWLTKKNRSR